MTDQQLEVIRKFNLQRGSHAIHHTEEEMYALCLGAKSDKHIGLSSLRSLVTHPDMRPRHVDLMLENNSRYMLSSALIKYCNAITKEHIDAMIATNCGLVGRTTPTSAMKNLHRDLMNHPLFTDAMKVKYNLLWGDKYAHD